MIQGILTDDDEPEKPTAGNGLAPAKTIDQLASQLDSTINGSRFTNGNGASGHHAETDTGLEPGEKVGPGGEIVNSEVQDAAKTEPAKTETPKEIKTERTLEEWYAVLANAPTVGRVNAILDQFVAAVSDATDQQKFREACELRRREIRSQKTANA